MLIRRNASCGDLPKQTLYNKYSENSKQFVLSYNNDKRSNFYSQLTIRYKNIVFNLFLSDSTKTKVSNAFNSLVDNITSNEFGTKFYVIDKIEEKFDDDDYDEDEMCDNIDICDSCIDLVYKHTFNNKKLSISCSYDGNDVSFDIDLADDKLKKLLILKLRDVVVKINNDVDTQSSSITRSRE